MQRVQSQPLYKRTVTPDKEFENAVDKLNDFFSYYDLNEARQKLEDWLYIAFTADRPELSDHLERSSLVYFSYKLRDLLEANFIVFKRTKSSPVTTKVTTRKTRKKPRKASSKH